MSKVVNVEKAGIADIDALVKLRLEYLIEDNGNFNDSEIIEIKKGGFRTITRKTLAMISLYL